MCNSLQNQGNQGVGRRHTSGTSHNEPHRLTPILRIRAIYGWKLGLDIRHNRICKEKTTTEGVFYQINYKMWYILGAEEHSHFPKPMFEFNHHTCTHRAIDKISELFLFIKGHKGNRRAAIGQYFRIQWNLNSSFVPQFDE